jgi:hypothetical protein
MTAKKRLWEVLLSSRVIKSATKMQLIGRPFGKGDVGTHR